MTPRLVRRRLAAAGCAVCAAAAVSAGAAGSRWQCAPTGASVLAPALTAAASEYLDRVEAAYPYRALGLVRAGDRFYLLNAGDVEWGERARLNLLALRLRETYLTAERRATATPGSAPPPGGFVCLAASRAAREGLGRTPEGEIVLAAGRSLHLVDPQEPHVAVEVVAAPDRALNLGGLFHRSAREGIYAGLSSRSTQRTPRGGGTAGGKPGGTVIFRMASAAGYAHETRVDALDGAGSPARQGDAAAGQPPLAVAAVQTPAARPPSVEGVKAVERAREGEVAGSPAVPAEKPAPTALADAAPVTAPAPSSTAPAPILMAAVPPPAAAPVPVVPAAAAVPPPAPAPIEMPERTVLPSSAASPDGSAQPAVRPAAGAGYEEYAKTMKHLMALRRSGGVRSISEMTYVHPAVEVFLRKR